MKALEKDRSRRYGTCGDLADDVKRFLKDEPIEARPPSASYKFSKLLRRHPEAVMVAMSFVAMMILTTGISVWLALKAATAEEELLQAIADVEIALKRSKRMEQQSRVSVQKARLESMEGSMAVEVFREVLINLIRRQAEVVVRAPSQPKPESEDTWSNITPNLSRGLAQTLELVKPLSPTIAASAALANEAGKLAMLKEAEDQLLRFLSTDDTAVDRDVSSADTESAVLTSDIDEALRQGSNAVTLSVLTTVALARRNFDQARDYADREIAIRKALGGGDWRLFLAHAQLGDALLGLQKQDEARTQFLVAWDGLSTHREQIPGIVRQSRLTHVLENLSLVNLQLGDTPSAKMWQLELAKLKSAK